jgi:hypothetical protein
MRHSDMSHSYYFEPFLGRLYENKVLPAIEKVRINGNWRTIKKLIDELKKIPVKEQNSNITQTIDLFNDRGQRLKKISIKKIEENYKIKEFINFLIRAYCNPVNPEEMVTMIEIKKEDNSYLSFVDFVNKINKKIDVEKTVCLLEKLITVPWFSDESPGFILVGYLAEDEVINLYNYLDKNENKLKLEGGEHYFDLLMDALERMKLRSLGLRRTADSPF